MGSSRTRRPRCSCPTWSASSSGRVCTVDVMRSDDVWHGMTYREDKPGVVAAIRSLIDAGEYPERLWD